MFRIVRTFVSNRRSWRSIENSNGEMNEALTIATSLFVAGYEFYEMVTQHDQNIS